MSKDKKKNNNQEVDGNQKLESNDNVKMHNKEHKCGNRTRRKSGEILTVAPPVTSYAQVIIAKTLRLTICYVLLIFDILSFTAGGTKEKIEQYSTEPTTENAE